MTAKCGQLPKMLTAKCGHIQKKVPTTSSQSILGFVYLQEPTAKTIVSKILADLISKVIDKSEKSVAKAKHRGAVVSEKQLLGWKAERL